MSPAHVHEPTYAAIKQRLRQGWWPPGSRLEGARIADEIGVSMTPVRDSLNRLVGERLVELRPGFGFHVPHLGVLDLRELLDLNLALLRAALRDGSLPVLPVLLEMGDDASASTHAIVADKTARLFRAIARRSRSQALEDALEALNDRLHAIRAHEERVFADTAIEFLHFEQLCSSGTLRELEQALRQYHLRRRRAAAQLLSLLERSGR